MTCLGYLMQTSSEMNHMTCLSEMGHTTCPNHVRMSSLRAIAVLWDGHLATHERARASEART
eukprot:scaffold203146_cov35-Tisochrysis_lutea.AAC.3